MKRYDKLNIPILVSKYCSWPASFQDEKIVFRGFLTICDSLYPQRKQLTLSRRLSANFSSWFQVNSICKTFQRVLIVRFASAIVKSVLRHDVRQRNRERLRADRNMKLRMTVSNPRGSVFINRKRTSWGGEENIAIVPEVSKSRLPCLRENRWSLVKTVNRRCNIKSEGRSKVGVSLLHEFVTKKGSKIINNKSSAKSIRANKRKNESRITNNKSSVKSTYRN